jgi:hypothetical protein
MKNIKGLMKAMYLAALAAVITISFPIQSVSKEVQQQIPEPVVPVYSKLKNLHLTTQLVDQSSAFISIVAPQVYVKEGLAIQKTIQEITGVEVPLLDDGGIEIPLQGNIILLGNRSTNRVISDLYDRAYTFLDLKYPGTGGFVVRSLHNPFGNGRNVLFAGGSDPEGVRAAATALISSIREAGGKKGSLSVNYIARIKLGTGYWGIIP